MENIMLRFLGSYFFGNAPGFRENCPKPKKYEQCQYQEYSEYAPRNYPKTNRSIHLLVACAIVVNHYQMRCVVAKTQPVGMRKIPFKTLFGLAIFIHYGFAIFPHFSLVRWKSVVPTRAKKAAAARQNIPLGAIYGYRTHLFAAFRYKDAPMGRYVYVARVPYLYAKACGQKFVRLTICGKVYNLR